MALDTHLLSTAMVSEILKVDESTVKRWTDSGSLQCFKTPGGHRKFRLKDVMEFSLKFSYQTSTSNMNFHDKNSLADIDFAIFNKNYQSLASKFQSFLLMGENKLMSEYLTYLYTNKFSIADIYDNVVKPAMDTIGTLWKDGKISVGKEHIASNALRYSLTNFHEAVYKKPSNGLIALCGCPGYELHDLGIFCVTNTLESEGWKAIYVGQNLPLDFFRDAVSTFKPDLVCLSTTILKNKKQMSEDFSSIYNLQKKNNGKFILGGRGFSALEETSFKADFIAHTIKDVLDFTAKSFKTDMGTNISSHTKQVEKLS